MEKEELDLKDLFSEKPDIKYHAAKKAIQVSLEDPDSLYPDFETFEKFLTGENNVLKWTATKVIGNLASVDTKNKINKTIPILISFISDKSMITAANAGIALSLIAKNKPGYIEEILKAIFGVEKAIYYNKGKPSPECRNVVLGHVLNSLPNFGEDILKRKDVREFLERQTKNTRPKVRSTAKKLLNTH